MNLNNHCPVQASIDNHCAGFDEGEAFDEAVDNRKEVIMRDLSKEIITEALAELPDSHKLWGDIIR
ncbi:hypothetical protein AXE65_12755 [Ventosimonas gracilis]|uniref:Uncharacterized protein n=1 Tax=Ventosimonas gracilis TaxID=1680762 RepID=A0A139SVF7_9GAMM|nr:hypothetical protein [Ventosimonas gracilis]KXU38559.1 hypothetical protein AXE65_12755 [Ventosimonas gracilis]